MKHGVCLTNIKTYQGYSTLVWALSTTTFQQLNNNWSIPSIITKRFISDNYPELLI